MDDGIDQELLAALQGPQWDEGPSEVPEEAMVPISTYVQHVLAPLGPSASNVKSSLATSSKTTIVQQMPGALLLRLPKELLLRIWAFLSVDELCKSAFICSTCKQLSEEQILWRRLFCARWGKPAQQEEASWKVLYQSKDAEERQSIAKMCDAGPQDAQMMQMYRDMQRARRQQALGRGHIDDTAEVPLSSIQARLDTWRKTYPPVLNGQQPRHNPGAAAASSQQQKPHSSQQPPPAAGLMSTGQPSGSVSQANQPDDRAAANTGGLSEALAIIMSPKLSAAQHSSKAQESSSHSAGSACQAALLQSQHLDSTGQVHAHQTSAAVGPEMRLAQAGADKSRSDATQLDRTVHHPLPVVQTQPRPVLQAQQEVGHGQMQQQCRLTMVHQQQQQPSQMQQQQQQPLPQQPCAHEAQAQPPGRGMATAHTPSGSQHVAARRPTGRRVVQRRSGMAGRDAAHQRPTQIGASLGVGSLGSHPVTRAWLEHQEARKPDLSQGREAFTWDQIGDYFCCRETGWIHLCDHSCRECIIDRTHDLLVCPISCRTVDRMLTEWELQMLERTNAGPVGHDEADFGGFMGRAYEAGYSCRNDLEFKRMLAGRGWRLK